MNDKTDIFLAILLGFTLGLFIGASTIEASSRNQAIEANVAEYYLDENHDKQFRYLSITNNL